MQYNKSFKRNAKNLLWLYRYILNRYWRYKKVGMRAYISSKSVVLGQSRFVIGDESMVLDHARVICALMPPYSKTAGYVCVGNNSIIREYSFLITYGGFINIGNNCTVNPFCMLQGNGGLTIGDGVRIGSHVAIIPANHITTDTAVPIFRQGETMKGINIDDDVWIGTHAAILDGVRIRTGSVVAAGAVVTRDVPEFAVVTGVPARTLKYRKLQNCKSQEPKEL